MPDPREPDIDEKLQALLRTEIATLRTLLAQREAEVLALLQDLDAQARTAIQDQELFRTLGATRRSRLNRLRHHFTLRRQAAALIDSGLFDAGWYAQRHPDCGGTARAAMHYLVDGAHAGHDPGPNFDTMAYYRANPDVAAEGWAALAHYVMHGRAEGRALRPVAKT